MTKKESAQWKCVTQVFKFVSDEAYRQAQNLIPEIATGQIDPKSVNGLQEVQTIEGNILLNEGINNGIWPLVAGDASATPFDNTNARIGVGDGTDPEDATQTGLTGLNQAYKGMDAGYPTYGTNQEIVFQATFGETEANFTWNEWTVDNGATAGVNLNRKVENLGTKSTGTWVLRVSLSLS